MFECGDWIGNLTSPIFLKFCFFPKFLSGDQRIIDSVLRAGPTDPKHRKRNLLSLDSSSVVVDHIKEAKEANVLQQIQHSTCLQ